jgi:hypothetical protein
MKNKEYKWYQDESVGGYIDDSGRLIVCEEYGTDADFDTHAVDVANGNGYYNENGKYIAYSKEDK